MRRWGCNTTIFVREEQNVMLFSCNRNCHQRTITIWIKFPDHSRLVCQSLKKLAFVEGIFLAAGDAVQWTLLLQRGLNQSQCIDCLRDKKKWQLQRGGCQWAGLTVHTFHFQLQIFAISDFPQEGRLIISKVINRSFKILNCKLSLISHLESVIPILGG